MGHPVHIKPWDIAKANVYSDSDFSSIENVAIIFLAHIFNKHGPVLVNQKYMDFFFFL